MSVEHLQASPAQTRLVAASAVPAERSAVIGAQTPFQQAISQSVSVAAQRAINLRIQSSPLIMAQRKSVAGIVPAKLAMQRAMENDLEPKEFNTAQRVARLAPLQTERHETPLSQLRAEPAAKPNNTGLPDNLKSGIESLSGIPMDGVKVHYNSPQPAQLNALAYAQGTDIHVAPRQEQHLPHEAWHVVQQAQGRVQPTMQMKAGMPINDDPGLEHEADVVGAKALQVPAKTSTRHLATLSGSKATQLTAPLEDYSASIKTQPLPNNGLVHLLPQSMATAVQRTVNVNGRELSKASLFGNSAFKDRLTRQIDVHAGRLGLGRDAVRNQIYDMIKSEDAHEFDSTAALMERAAGDAANKVIDKEMDGHEAEENWLLFGMDGKTKAQVEHAVRIGYRNFDCAESYGTTTRLAEVIQASNVDREEFSITYKFDLRKGELAKELEQRLRGVAKLFGDHLEDIVIHNLDATEEEIKAAWQVLQELREDGLADSIGVGNLKEGHAHLLEELKKIGEVDIVENSLSSVLASPDLREMIKNSGAALLYYDVIRTATDIGINSESGIRALIASTANLMGDAQDKERNSQTHMIMSSGNLKRNIGNFKKFGDGADREYDYSDETITGHMTQIFEWQKSQEAATANDEDFALDGVAAAVLSEILDGANGAQMRLQINNAAGGEEHVTKDFIRNWLNTNTDLSLGLQDSQKVPGRKKLKKRYLGMPLGAVLGAMFFRANCDWKWSVELVQLMLADVETWDAIVDDSFEEIVFK